MIGPESGPSVTGSIRPIDHAEDLREVGHEWRVLEGSADCAFFLSWGWIGPWAHLMIGRAPLSLLRCEAGGVLVGLAFVSRRRVRHGRGLIRATQLQLNEFDAPQCDMTMEYNGILSARGHEAATWRAFAQALLALPDPWDELRCRSLTAAQRTHAAAAFAALHEEVERRVSSWALPLAAEQTTDDLLLPVFRKKTRQQMKQTIRAFDALGPVTLDLAETRDQALEFFDAMDHLHTARWERVGRAGSFANSLWRSFHRTIIRNGFDRGDVMISRLTCAGEAVGFVYGLMWRQRLYAQQTGFKPHGRPALRSGYLTHLRTMQAVAARGIRHYDLLPDESWSYKRLLAEPDGEFTTTFFRYPRFRFRILRVARRLVSQWKQFSQQPTASPTHSTPETDA